MCYLYKYICLVIEEKYLLNKMYEHIIVKNSNDIQFIGFYVEN